MQPSILTLTDVTFTYPDASEPLFTGVSASFPRGWSAVLGDNGIGKSTLMAIARGTLRPDGGTVVPDPTRLVVGYCPQDIATVPANLDDFAADWSPEAIALRDDLKLGDDWPFRYDTLSGGERKRMQIACALADRPDMLILDEPTNHVDAGTRDHIIAAMRRFRGIGIVVSHDVTLIDATCNRCVALSRRHVGSRNVTVADTYPGGCTRAARLMDARAAADASASDAARRETARLQSVKARRFADVQRLDAAKRGGRRIDPKDHDARAAMKYGRPTIGAATTRQYTQLNGRLDAARRRAEGLTTAAKRYDGDIWLDIEPSRRRELARLEPGVIRFGGRHLADARFGAGHPDEVAGSGPGPEREADEPPAGMVRADVSGDRISLSPPADGAPAVGLAIPTISIGPRDHVAVTGPNGTGKSTLLRAMVARAADVPKLVVAQDATRDDAVRALERLRALRPADRARVLGAYARLNADPDRLLKDGEPSPGELRKLLLCLSLPGRPQLIVMDEPTNHLDLSSKEALARLLADYPGALVVASHDGWFLERVFGSQFSAPGNGEPEPHGTSQ
ncbi:ABC-F family ATP-binding cassette domain-containing protein [Bifidobacterium sp. CP2]|uniref:ATP-binding cassette domain-containing protein n=1 Tax=Bifidobacterium sp. CP2 TaxID=2809025 RepID=UPI001BDC5F74|nr:ATP-binding cassette domain-containing protein [Bifidobacterium sp. CP2]MBT1180433.1 ABC-F family ATP-binding cassette domain-containing protein [Bifidobacterium sp. CP2]